MDETVQPLINKTFRNGWHVRLWRVGRPWKLQVHTGPTGFYSNIGPYMFDIWHFPKSGC